MRNITALFFALFLFIACGHSGFDEKNIIIDESSTLIDVRTEQEFKKGHLKNAINISHVEIKDKIGRYVKDRNKKIILYCRSGRRSGIAKKILTDMGYKKAVNAGSYKKLKKAAILREKE